MAAGGEPAGNDENENEALVKHLDPRVGVQLDGDHSLEEKAIHIM